MVNPITPSWIDLRPYITQQEVEVEVIDLSRPYSTLDSLSKVYRPQNEDGEKGSTYTVDTTDSFFDIDFD